jgi:hypothetical protein
MANVLLTGGRAPATLDLARSFHTYGHRVFLAESLSGCLTAASRATDASFIVPPPRQQPAAFVQALTEIIRQEQIDLLIPTCEEIFYVAMGREKLAGLCTVFVEPIERLRLLHDKWAFIQTAQSLGLPVPATLRIETEADLSAAFARWPRLVLKPVYSRFASRTLILGLGHRTGQTCQVGGRNSLDIPDKITRPPDRSLPASITFASLRASPASPWVAQEYLAGKPICTYSVAHAGRLTAHSAYRSVFTAGQGATIHFQHVEHPASLDWVRRFIEAFSFTGQIAFDFIEEIGPGGSVRAIECNPRATSGIHLLAAAPHFPNAFFDAEIACLFPPAQPAPMLLSAMLLYGLPSALKKQSLSRWWQAFRSGRDVIFRQEDARPAFAQWRSLLHFVALGWRHKITPLEASTRDIEWNGEV